MGLLDYIQSMGSNAIKNSGTGLYKSAYSSNATYPAGNVFGEQPKSSGTYPAGNIYGEQPKSSGTYPAGNIYGQQPKSYGTYPAGNLFNSAYSQNDKTGSLLQGLFNSGYRKNNTSANNNNTGVTQGLLDGTANNNPAANTGNNVTSISGFKSLFSNPLYMGKMGMNYSTPMSKPLYFGKIGMNYSTPFMKPTYFGKILSNYGTDKVGAGNFQDPTGLYTQK